MRSGGFEKRREHARTHEKLESGGLNGGRANLVVRHQLTFDNARHNPMAGKLARGKKAGRPSADDEDAALILPASGRRKSMMMRLQNNNIRASLEQFP
jgi:hypothetical protein